eukprot:TRINITY_DN1846_c0_g1_i10.p1 TRINITY_DN1846_c0_g1~~TRINITY_DN1846_c0_g1_i10.p1  ORF type:complete len:134 (-),score=29.71 TRINITY_DN1846_c0_g1_i10:380-781(-)
MNDIKSYCYVMYNEVQHAIEARKAVYGVVWPTHNKGEPLVAEFVSVDDVMRAVERQTRATKRRRIEEPPPSSLDKLFRKTVAKPNIYYLPLTDAQVEEKRAKRLEEERQREQRRKEREEERKKLNKRKERKEK